MKFYIRAGIVIGFLILGAVFYCVRQVGSQSQPKAEDPYLSANQQSSEFPTNVGLDCAGCHGAGKTLPSLGGEKFHKDAHGATAEGIHGKAAAAGRRSATCVNCHTVNGDMTTALPAKDPKSTVNRANMAQTCGSCHQESLTSFHISIHGSRRDAGETKPASCADCHGSHEILLVSDIHSTLNREATASTTCVKCHSTEVDDYLASSHGLALKGGNEKAPNCTDCHTAVSHLKAPLSLRDFNLQTVTKCIECHETQAPSFRDTFHGQATALEFKPAATCADCHTSHRNLPANDTMSSVHKDNLIQTCASCHSNANAGFVTYDPHPQPNDPERSALVYYVSHFMEWLLIGVFSFFGLHTLLWFQRSLVAYFTEKHEETADDKQYVVRFAKIHRFTHVLIVVSFIILAATGLPLMFYYTPWGQAFEVIFGGLGPMRLLHRICAVITLGYVLIHLYYVVRKALFEKNLWILYGPDSMMIRKQDFVDLFNMIRWFLYLGPRPKLDRWTYWEKFDYFAVFWGVPVIGISGLMLWFPEVVTRFLPGVVLNLAMIIHGEEALLATAFIFAFHFFHNHLRPENFPMDISIFTGKLTLARFKEERGAEYERLVEDGQLETILTDPPSPRARLISNIFGATAYIAGLIMIIALLTTLILYRH